MTTEQAKQLSDNAITRLMEALERGQSDALNAYLSVMSRFRQYSWHNVLMIYSQCPSASHVAGFHSWLRLGRHVRKGEKGIAIFAPMVGRKRGSEDTPEQDEQKRLLGFRVTHVFDVVQTDGEPLPEFATVHGDPQQFTDRLVEFVAVRGIALEYSNGIAPAKGISSGGKITLLPRLSPAETFAVLVHEVSHELLHKGERRSQTDHIVRETEAEAVAFVVSTAIGLEPGSSSSDYILLHSGDRATLAESLTFIQQTAAEILDAIFAASELAEPAAA